MTALVHAMCPPNQNAFCTCGDTLADHLATDPDNIPTPGDAVCRSDAGGAFWERRTPAQFQLAAGDTLDCDALAYCNQCGDDLCTDHSPEFVTCVTGGTLHCLGCRYECSDCGAAAAEDYAADRGEELAQMRRWSR